MASDINVVATITRANLASPLAELDINDLVNYELSRNVDIGSVTWRKETVTSPFVHGRTPVHEVKDVTESKVGVYVMGDTRATLDGNIETLIEAFTEQYSYELRLQVEGRDYHWRCERADYQVAFQTEMIAAAKIPVIFSFFRHPVQMQGVI